MGMAKRQEMTLGELKIQVGTWLTATWEWIKETTSTIDKWIIDVASGAYEWLLELGTSAHAWLTKIIVMVQEGNTDSLPLDEIILAIPITIFGTYLFYRLLVGLVKLPKWIWHRVNVAAHILAGKPPPRPNGVRSNNVEPFRGKRVLHQGRWTIHGYEDPFVAEKRRRSWRKKVMTPQEQQRYVEKVQRQERKKRDKAARNKQSGSNTRKPDKEEVREEAKRRL